jgi:hypothetical protein
MRQVSKLVSMMVAVVLVATAVFSGCAKNAPLRTEGTTSGIRAAEEAGAAQLPQASLHLHLAKEGLERARELAAKGEKRDAASMLMRAEADGKLALALSHEDAQKAEALAALERVRQLQKENQ